MPQPRFITLEGGEGAGKSTQLKLLAGAFAQAGIKSVTTREPGGSPGAEAIRGLVVTGAADAWDPVTESLLFMAARADHVDKLVKPALAAGKWVLCDRYFDSTLVYQGIGKEVGTEWLGQLYTLLFGNFIPDATVLLDLPPENGLARAAARGNAAESRFERMGEEYHRKIHDGFRTLAKAHKQRFITIDAAAAPVEVHRRIVEALNKRFALSLAPVAR